MTNAVRAKKFPELSEHSLHLQVVDYLRALQRSGVRLWFTHPVNEGKRHIVAAVKAKRMGQTPGAPDFILCFQGHFFAVELKATKGVLTTTQRAALSAIDDAGGFSYVCRSINQLIEILDIHAVPRLDRGREAA